MLGNIEVSQKSKDFLGFIVHNRNDGCIRMEERVKEGGIPVSFGAEEEKEMEQSVYSRSSLCRQNVLYLVGQWFFSFSFYFFLTEHVLLYLCKHACFLPKMVEPFGLHGGRNVL